MEEKGVEMSEAMMIQIMMNDLWINDERTVEWALLRISKYLYGKDDKKMGGKQKAFFAVGRHLAIVRAMKEHPNDKWTQINGLCMLAYLTYRNTSIKAAIAKVEGIQTILTAMKRFPSDQTVIRSGFVALNSVIF